MNCWPFKSNGKRLFAVTRWVGRSRAQRLGEFPALFAQLRDAKLNLDQSCGGLETQFLAISSELESLAGVGEQFVKQVEKLVGLATGQDSDHSAFSSAICLVEQSTEFLSKCQEETGQMLEQLRNYNAQIERLLGVETELHRTLLPLRFVQTLFKSESAPLGPVVQEIFGTLTREIEGLHGQVQEIFGTKFEQLKNAQQTINHVIAQLDRQARSLAQVVATHKAQIESSLELLKKEMASNQDRDMRLARLSQDLTREVGQVVMGLQCQDMISQKLGHVTALLPQIESKFAEFESASNGATRNKSLQFLHQSCRLEAGQLDASQQELAQAEATIRGGIEKVMARMTEVDSQCLSLEEFKLLTTSFDGMVQVLLEKIEEVRNLVAETVARAAEAYEMLRPLGSLASDLTAVVRAMSVRIHLIGLNSQVQAAQASQDRRGAGLEVLSARTSEISEETNRISEEAAGRLDALAAGLAEAVRSFEQLQAQGTSQQSVLNEQGRMEEAQLHAFRNRALEALREIGDSLDAIQDRAQRALSSVQFAPFYQVTLPTLRAPLVAIADAAEGQLKAHGCGVAQDNLIEGFRRDYTMASEREVFAGVVSAAPSASAKPDAFPEMDLGANVELF